MNMSIQAKQIMLIMCLKDIKDDENDEKNKFSYDHFIWIDKP